MESVTEWSVAFDSLYNNITSNQAPGLNEYEKSLYLTRAQEQLVMAYFSPKSNALAEGFDGSPRRQSDFSTLIRTSTLSTTSTTPTDRIDKRDTDSVKCYSYPADSKNIIAVLNENIFASKTSGGNTIITSYTVVPVSYEEYERLMSKPYKYPPKGHLWRLFNSTKTTTVGDNPTEDVNNHIEVIGRFDTMPAGSTLEYQMRYVLRPEPIILADLDEYGLTIEGNSDPAPCALPVHLHDEILQRAVMLAKLAWADPVPSTTQER